MLTKKAIVWAMLLAFCLTGCTAEAAQAQLSWLPNISSPTAQSVVVGNYILKSEGRRHQLYDKAGQLVLALDGYDTVRYRAGILVCKTEDTTQYIHVTGKILAGYNFCEYDYGYGGVGPVYPMRAENGLYGYVNEQQYWWLPPVYSLADNFSEGVALVDAPKTGFININGDYQELVLQDGVPSIAGMHSGRLLLETYGDSEHTNIATYITVENAVLPANPMRSTLENTKQYYYWGAQDFSDGMGAVRTGEYWGFIDLTGKLVIPPTYTTVSPFQNGVAAVADKSGQMGLIDRTGNMVEPFFMLPSGYTFEGQHAFGLYQVRSAHGTWNLVDGQGNLVFKKDYYYLGLQDGLWIVSKEVLSSGIFFPATKSVVMMSALKFPGYYSYGDTILVHGQAADYVYQLSSGKKLFSAPTIEPFSEGLACVRLSGGQYGYINTQGAWVYQPQFSAASSFRNGIASVTQGSKSGFIANPLIYENNWDSSELKRAVSLDLAEGRLSEKSDTINFETFFELIQNMFHLQSNLPWYTEQNPEQDYQNFCNEFWGEYPDLKDAGTQPLTTEYAALVFAEVARYWGHTVDAYIYPYDVASSDYCASGVAYCSAFNIFPSDDFTPDRPLSCAEAVDATMHFWEAML